MALLDENLMRRRIKHSHLSIFVCFHRTICFFNVTFSYHTFQSVALYYWHFASFFITIHETESHCSTNSHKMGDFEPWETSTYVTGLLFVSKFVNVFCFGQPIFGLVFRSISTQICYGFKKMADLSVIHLRTVYFPQF